MTTQKADTAFPYEQDYLRYLLEKETRREKQFQFKARSPQLSYRKSLVKSTRNLAEELHLSCTTVHLAIHLLDLFMDSHDILPAQLMLAASTCLLVSAKYVDVDQNIPRISTLQKLTKKHNTVHEYLLMEKMLLNFWRWDLNCATTIHFLEYMLSCDWFPSSHDGRIEQGSCTPNDFKTLATKLANVALSEVQFIYFKPSQVAAACISAALIQLKVFPVWPPRLEQLTGYVYDDIDPCVQSLLYFGRVNLRLPAVVTTVTPRITAAVFTCEGQNTDWKKYKLKAPATSYNCARTRRQTIQSRDLKKMYCAM